jgi:hypothetical protein
MVFQLSDVLNKILEIQEGDFQKIVSHSTQKNRSSLFNPNLNLVHLQLEMISGAHTSGAPIFFDPKNQRVILCHPEELSKVDAYDLTFVNLKDIVFLSVKNANLIESELSLNTIRAPLDEIFKLNKLNYKRKVQELTDIVLKEFEIQTSDIELNFHAACIEESEYERAHAVYFMQNLIEAFKKISVEEIGKTALAEITILTLGFNNAKDGIERDGKCLKIFYNLTQSFNRELQSFLITNIESKI